MNTHSLALEIEALQRMIMSIRYLQKRRVSGLEMINLWCLGTGSNVPVWKQLHGFSKLVFFSVFFLDVLLFDSIQLTSVLILQTRAVFGFGFQTAYLSMIYFDRFLSRRAITVSFLFSISSGNGFLVSSVNPKIHGSRTRSSGQLGYWQWLVFPWLQKWRN